MYDYDLQSFELDTNGDGMVDTYAEQFDTNGDGIIDTYSMMTDGDGDGYFETQTTAIDSNNSGNPDTFIQQVDTNADGQADVVNKGNDYNQDGQIDNVRTYADTNGDGQYDYMQKSYDSDNDGVMDKTKVYQDTTGNMDVDNYQAYNLDPSTGELTPTAAAPSDIDPTAVDREQFDPLQANDDDVSGDPEADMEHWECQGDTNRCALYSQKFVIEELSPDHKEIDIDDFAQTAEENGWFDEEGGTTFLNMNKMLNYYGIDNEMSFNNDISDIEETLDNGGKVIVSVDSNEIWGREDHQLFSPESGANHAVEVIGIDRSDPDNPMVILNDSAPSNGKGEMIPLQTFEDAWEDGDCQMIKCYPNAA